MRETVAQKTEVIPNGINEYWINHLQTTSTANPHHLLYAGNFNRNKNLPRLIHSVLALRTAFPDIHLDVAGEGGDDEHHVRTMMEKHSDCISYHGKITELEQMQELYRANSILAMPSKSETFGLVYVEALSQGLKVLWSRGEAIEGLFPEHIGEHVNPLNNNDITNALEKMLRHPENYEPLPSQTFDTFRWNSVASHYRSLYKNIE
jgi:glycosyltransferase involved in cell wall biosynthesis